MNPAASCPIKVAIFEDNRKLLRELKDLFDGAPGFNCVLAASSLREAVSRVETAGPDVVILDIRFGQGNGLRALADVKRARPDQHVLMHTAADMDQDMLMAHLLGAGGYVVKGDHSSRILEAAKLIASGMCIVSPRVVWALRQETLSPRPPEWVAALTPAELDVLKAFAEGSSPQEVAMLRGRAMRTIEKQCHSILIKAHSSCMRDVVKGLGPWGKVLRFFRDLMQSPAPRGRAPV